MTIDKFKISNRMRLNPTPLELIPAFATDIHPKTVKAGDEYISSLEHQV